jgi:hypothetical protein
MKVSGHVEQQQSPIKIGTKLLNGLNTYDFRGTWVMVNPESKLIDSNNLTGKPTITFDSYIEYAPWKYTKYCCDVNIQDLLQL